MSMCEKCGEPVSVDDAITGQWHPDGKRYVWHKECLRLRQSQQDQLTSNLIGMCKFGCLQSSRKLEEYCTPCIAAARLMQAAAAFDTIVSTLEGWQADECSERVMRLAEGGRRAVRGAR